MSRARRSTALVLGVLLVGSLAACTKDEPENPFPNGGSLPGNTGSTCEDRTGDLSPESRSLGGNLSAPAGADIVKAEARLDETRLKVSMTMAAPIIGTPDPDFVLAQGLPNEETSFELHAEPTDETAQTWRLRLVRYRKDARGYVSQVVPDTVLTTPVKVDGATISYDVAQTDIPRVASYVWQFGTSAKGADGVTVLDVCDGAGAGTQPGDTAPGTTAPPRKMVGKLGETLSHGSGVDVTLFAVESPPTNPTAGATPAQEGSKLATADVQVCVAGNGPATSGAQYVFIQPSDNRVVGRKTNVTAPPHEPELPAELTLTAQPSTARCRRGWVTFEIAQDANPMALIYGTDISGVGAVQFELA